MLNHVLGPKRPRGGTAATRRQGEPYESGIPVEYQRTFRFGVSFYLVAMLFILFDVDAAFLYPWALVFKELGVFGFVEMMVFMGLLGSGFAYAWKSGAFEW